MSKTVLKGGISNCTYIWRANMCACDKCQELDNTIYYYEEDVPDLPHPNCKCYVEVVENENNKNDYDRGNSKKNKDDEKCDCLEDLFVQIEELIADAQNLQNQISESITNFEKNLKTKYFNFNAVNIIENCIDALEQIFGTIDDFINNYNDMKEANTIGADKYFHSKANCDGAQRGELGAAVAKGISDLREFTDLFKNVLIKGMTVEESQEDSKYDQEANEFGRQQGRNNPNESSKVLVDIYRPVGLPDKY